MFIKIFLVYLYFLNIFRLSYHSLKNQKEGVKGGTEGGKARKEEKEH